MKPNPIQKIREEEGEITYKDPDFSFKKENNQMTVSQRWMIHYSLMARKYVGRNKRKSCLSVFSQGVKESRLHSAEAQQHGWREKWGPPNRRDPCSVRSYGAGFLCTFSSKSQGKQQQGQWTNVDVAKSLITISMLMVSAHKEVLLRMAHWGRTGFGIGQFLGQLISIGFLTWQEPDGAVF